MVNPKMAPKVKRILLSPSPVMTAEELAAYLRIHRTTVYRLIKAGTIPFFRVGTDVRFHRDVIDGWMKRQR